MATRTLQNECRAAGTTPKACLDFLLCLMVVEKESRQWDPRSALLEHRTDDRTVRRLLKRGGVDRKTRPTVAQFLNRQTFLPRGELLEAIRRELKAADSRR